MAKDKPSKEIQRSIPSYLTTEDIPQPVRRAVWRALGTKSFREIAEETGLTPEQVINVKTQLLDEVDALTLAEQRMKLMVTMQTVTELALEKAQNATDERNFSGLLNSASSSAERVLKELRRIERDDKGAVEQLNALRVRELLRLMDRVVKAGAKEIAEEHGLEEHEVLEVFQRHLVSEAAEMEA